MSHARYNVVLVHWHDLGRHLGCYGVASAPSPNVNSLAAQSVRFDNAFCAAPLCSPARGALFTGRYPHANGLMGLSHLGWEYAPGQQTLPAILGSHGYRTALAGLQHESADDSAIGFAETFATDKPCAAGAVSDAASAWLSARADDDRPFFLTVGFSEVHRPYPVDVYLPDDPREVDVPAFLPDNEWVRDDLAAFQGSIRVADAGVGQILAAIDRGGLADSTIVIFTTDHGIAFPRAKSTLYDAGIGVSLIVRLPPGFGAVTGPTDRLTSHVDVVPTLLDLLSLPTPGGLHGISHARALTGRDAPPRGHVFAEKTYHDCYDPIRAIRSREWKYIVNAEERPALIFPVDIDQSASRYGYGAGGDVWLRHRPAVELYNLADDPAEHTNLAGRSEYADVQADLTQRLHQWQVTTGDPLLAGPIAAWPRPRLARFGALPVRSGRQ